MDHTAETYRVKVHRDESTVRCRAKNSSCCMDGCPKPKKKKGSKCKTKKNPSLDTIKKSLSVNCCACCCVLADYIKEACKLICSCLNEKPTETRICELFSQLLELSWCLGSDCCHLIKHLFRFLCVYKK
ncbi:uncharacterized protein LOC114350460 [Ostrinia furnacalis]|uniref:uncharacterized protein LOC114350460 n=1 Tax=Ostrinia furnacalis TaxID=93504 RepID=UPI00103938B8|nr:uncharacterized protein LOC114350460 [Ostrinia furnacalis]